MRKFYSLAPLTVLIILIATFGSKAQSTKANGGNANNRQNNTDFLGWQATSASPGPLLIKNDIPNQPINLFAGGTQRMTILGTNGFVGIGVTNPTDILHLHDGPNSTLHITSTSTGSASNRGMKMGMLFNSTAGNFYLINSSKQTMTV